MNTYYNLFISVQLQRERKKHICGVRNLDWYSWAFIFLIFKLFINNIGSICHHVGMWGEGNVRWLVGSEGELGETGWDIADRDENFYYNLEASPWPELQRTRFWFSFYFSQHYDLRKNIHTTSSLRFLTQRKGQYFERM